MQNMNKKIEFFFNLRFFINPLKQSGYWRVLHMHSWYQNLHILPKDFVCAMWFS